MIKVLFIIPNLGHGGAERVLVNLVNRMDPSRFDVTVQTMFDVGVYKDAFAPHVKYLGGFPVYFRGNSHALKLLSPKQLYRHYVKKTYDVVISYLEGSSARLVSGCDDLRTKLVSWVHIEMEDKEYAAAPFRSLREASRCYARFDRIVSVSSDVELAFRSVFPSERPSLVLYNTVEVDTVRAKSKEAVRDVDFKGNEIKLCSVAKLMAVKGYDRLMRVCARLRQDGFPIHLYLVGKGEERERLEILAKELNFAQWCTFVGFTDNPYKYVANCDLYVCSSFREGFSTAVTEALIVGTPVVSTCCSGATELLGEHNEYGIVTPNTEDGIYDGIKKILEDPGLLERYKRLATIRGKRFSPDTTVKAVEQMLEELVSE